MTSMVDNGTSGSQRIDVLDMPQWKRDLIMRRRAQQQANKDNSAQQSAASVNNRQLDSCVDACNSCACAAGAAAAAPAASSSVTLAGRSTAALLVRPPSGHQPTCCAGAPADGGGGGVAHAYAGSGASCASSSLNAGSCSSTCGEAECCAACGCECQPNTTTETTCLRSHHRSGHHHHAMVHLHADSDPTEELKYGPGIVSKLKNRYLSLTLRTTVIKRRPSILRRSTSLENVLDDGGPLEGSDVPTPNGQLLVEDAEKPRRFEARKNGSAGNARNVANRYRGATTTCGSMKRARSVETISRIYSKDDPQQQLLQQQVAPAGGGGGAQQQTGRPKSLHEGELTGTFAINPIITPRVNKPKRLTPVITEREKPPADVVKQAKKIFETRPESRTRPPHHTGEVAAKVASYKTIIIQTKQANALSTKPPIKQKPVVPTEIIGNNQRNKPITLVLKATNGTPPLTSPNGPQLPASPILSPANTTNSSISSPIPDVSMVSIPPGKESEEDKKPTSLSQTPDLILHSSPVHLHKDKDKEKEQYREKDLFEGFSVEKEKEDVPKPPVVEREDLRKPETETKSVTKRPISPLTPPAKIEPLTLDIATYKPVVNNRDPVLVLSPREIEKNAINAACTPKLPSVIPNNSSNLPPLPANPPRVEALLGPAQPVALPRPKVRKSKQAPESNGIIINYSGRKDVPDYVRNDGHTRTQNLPVPKAGEGGITLLHGSTIQDVFGDEDEFLRGPPSPCDVEFINDNVIIDGKSSLSKKSKKSKLKIHFVEANPLVFEYPSEVSMLSEDTPVLNQPLGGTTVPSLAGSTLANYTPKVAASEFQLGVTKTAPPPITATDQCESATEEEVVHDPPMLFSSGTNADILF